MNLFSFPDDARWNAAADAVEFGIEVGEYRGVVRVPSRVFRYVLERRATPQSCIEAYYLYRSELERVAQVKLRAGALTDDGNIELSWRDLGMAGARSRGR